MNICSCCRSQSGFLDDFTRESVTLEGNFSFPAARVVRDGDNIAEKRAFSIIPRSDDGHGFGVQFLPDSEIIEIIR